MSKKNNSQPVVNDPQSVVAGADNDTTVATPVPVNVPVPAATPAPLPRLMDVDKLALDLAKERRQTALAEAKTALAKSETAELNFRYTVLQLYMKYNMDSSDALSENGDIIKGGAVQQQTTQGQ